MHPTPLGRRSFGLSHLFTLTAIFAACSDPASSETPAAPGGGAGGTTAGAANAGSATGGASAVGSGGAATLEGGADSTMGGASAAAGNAAAGGTAAGAGTAGIGGAAGSTGVGGGAGAGGMPGTESTAKQKVLAYFAAISGKQTAFGVENKGTLHGDTDHVKSITGKQPGFWGNDFGFGSGAIALRKSLAGEAAKQWSAGAVVGLMYHACAATRDEYCSWDDVGGAHPQHLMDSEWNELTTPGTALYKSWTARLDSLAVVFQQLKDAGVAPLFRPFHEMNQCAFWWSCKKGDHGSAKLYQLTHDYLVKLKGLDNIIWVWNVQDFANFASDVSAYNPGPDYFDVAALDVYNTGYTSGNYNTMLGAAAGKPIAIGECQFMPSLDLLKQQPKWIFAMLWPDFYANNPNLASLYASQAVLSEDEMPGWK